MFSCTHSYLFTCLQSSGGEVVGGYTNHHHPSHVSAAAEDTQCGHTPGTAPLLIAVTGFHRDLANTTSQHTSEIRTSVNVDTWWNYLLNHCQQAFSFLSHLRISQLFLFSGRLLTLAIPMTGPSLAIWARWMRSLSEMFSSDMSGEDSPQQRFLCAWAEQQQLQLQSHLRSKALGLLQTACSILSYILKWADIQYKVCGAFILLWVCLFYKHLLIPFNRKLCPWCSGHCTAETFIPASFTTALIAPETFFRMCLVFSQKHNKRYFRENTYFWNSLG